MKPLLRVFLFAFFAGIGVGWILAQAQQRREEQAAHEAFANDPEVKEIMAESRRMHKVDQWLDEITESEI